MCDAPTSSTHASCAALRRVAASGLAAFSQICSKRDFALGASVDAFSIARTQAVVFCSGLAFGRGGATDELLAGGAGEVPLGDTLPAAVEVLPGGVEVPLASVAAVPLGDVTVAVLLPPQPASTGAPASATSSHRDVRRIDAYAVSGLPSRRARRR
jgi:hypothetical protein